MSMMYIRSSIWSGFEIKKLNWRSISIKPKIGWDLNSAKMHFCSIFVEIVTSIGGELWQEQAQNEVKPDFGVQFDLEGHNQSSRKTIGILTKVFYISCPNLVILAWTGDELSCGQAGVDAHTWTHRQTQAMTIPKGQNWPRVTNTT